jgi:phenylacetate-CoA ligase
MVHLTSPAGSAVAVADKFRQIRAFGQRLAWTERLSARELQAHQAPQLSHFLAYARQNTDFYKGRLDPATDDSIGEAWSQIPILTRAQAVENRERLFSERVPAEAGRVVEGGTSGSTGIPLRYRSTAAFSMANCALTERMFRWWRVDGKKPFAQITRGAKSRSAEETTYGWQSARPNGPKYSLGAVLDIDTQLKWLLARRPAYLTTFAGLIKELAVTAKGRGAVLGFELIFSVGSVVDAETRELSRSVFGAEIADTYGAQEGGHIAAQCPDCGEYHISADTTVVELLRDDGSPAAAGEIGRVVVTPLHNLAMPLIRYELGDYAEVGTTEPACGRKLPTLRRILGRHRNMFRFRDGTRVWPILYHFLSIRDYVKIRQL